jgi:hypothetical protein
MESPKENVIFETSKRLNALNRVYERSSVQRTNMVTPAYEPTLPRLTTDYPAQVAAYDEKHTNSPLKATQLGLDDTVSQSRYMVMCTQSHQARKRYTIGAALFSWLILAGYLVLPNTFTSLQSSNTLSGSKGGQLLQSTVRNVKLLPFAGVLCLIGVAGISRLWYKWRRNYVWLITYIFMYVKLEILTYRIANKYKGLLFRMHLSDC